MIPDKHLAKGGISLEWLKYIDATKPKRPHFTPSPHTMPNLWACPTCSHATAGLVHFIRRPVLVCGQRSGIWMLVGAPGCRHCDHKRPEQSSDDPAALVARWNTYAEKKAAIVVERRGLTGERKDYFLKALLDPKL